MSATNTMPATGRRGRRRAAQATQATPQTDTVRDTTTEQVTEQATEQATEEARPAARRSARKHGKQAGRVLREALRIRDKRAALVAAQLKLEEEISGRLRDIREARNETLEDVAGALGMDQSTMSVIERGKTFNPATVDRILEYYIASDEVPDRR